MLRDFLEMVVIIGGVVIGFGLAGFGIAFLINTINLNPGDFELTGRIIAVGNQGLFCKTNEATIALGGLTNGSGTAGESQFLVTLSDTSHVRIFKERMDTKTPVTISFHRPRMYSWCSSSSGGDFVTNIK